ncbi:MAG TPA: response regulator [Polyangiaceae bacterium]|nr:response regulator [Polyangiaceae bacterium]
MTSGLHRLSGACVLIVDDDAGAADLYALWLRDVGHRPSIVSDAKRALILAPILRPAVVVAAIGLPGMDGIELVRRLRELSELAHCRYVAITADADASLPGRCRAAGFAEFFEKPLQKAALLKSFGVLRSAADLHHARGSAWLVSRGLRRND